MRNDIARANDALTVVNDWQLHLFKNGDAAASIFGAVGLQAISFSPLIHFSNINSYVKVAKDLKHLCFFL